MATLGLLRPKKIHFYTNEVSDVYGIFTVEPLARGFGHTLGNAIRRVLLSSIEGSAIVAIRIDGIYHEFSSIPGLVEDTTELILNLKKVRLNLFTDQPKVIVLDTKKQGPVYARDIKADPDIEVVNPDAYICTLDVNSHLKIEMVAKKGLGYAISEENIDEDFDLGFIPIDCIFSPIQRVSYKVEPTRLGKSINYDRLVMEIHTDGSIKPQEALDKSSRLLRDYMMPFLMEYESPQVAKTPIDKQWEKKLEYLNKNVVELELSVRSAHCLRNANIKTIRDLVLKTEAEMIKTKNFGKKSLNEIKQILASMGLRLGMTPEELEPPTPVASQ